MKKNIFIVFGLVFALFACDEPNNHDQSKMPLTDKSSDDFSGVIGRTRDESQPAWPERPVPAKGAPNVLIWLLDDAGYAQLSPYGSIINTPTVQKIANQGLVFSDFHSVPLCSPARAALLAGRNHHSVSMGSHIMSPAGFPGYFGQIPKKTASLGAVLKQEGYATYAFGKWDQTPMSDASVAGPFDLWPSGQGFERFYGFLGGEAHHFHPAMWADHTPIEPAENREDYFLTTDIAEKAIEYVGGLRAANRDKPFFIYWSTGAVHAPHHAPKSYIEKYKGKFDMGWDKLREATLARQIKLGLVPEGTQLSPRAKEIPAWDSLTQEEQIMFARQMEVFAAQLEHTDYEFGRIIEYLDDIGELDNTIIIITSDNGASAEGGVAGLHNEALSFNSKEASLEQNYKFFDEWGGPNTVPHYHAGWASAGNTPFPYYKHQVDGGGTHVPFIASIPNQKFENGVRQQYSHIIDVVPTVLDLLEIEPPEFVDGVKQKPHDGISLKYAIDKPEAKSKRTTQYYEIWGNRGIYSDGWKAATIHNHIQPWQKPVPGRLEDDVWRLYHVAEDFSQSKDLASKYPEKLKALQELWEVEARKYGVFPLDPDRRTRFRAQMNKSAVKDKKVEFYPRGAVRVPEALSPSVKNKNFGIEAFVTDGKDLSGVMVAAGGVTGGYSFYIDKGYPVFAYNLYNEDHILIKSDTELAAGESVVTFRFEKNKENNGGVGVIAINGQETARGVLRETIPNAFSIEDTFDIGADTGTTVVGTYKAPFAIDPEALEKVVIHLE